MVMVGPIAKYNEKGVGGENGHFRRLSRKEPRPMAFSVPGRIYQKAVFEQPDPPFTRAS